MSDYDGKKGDVTGQASCAYFGEGVIFKGSITAPEKVVVHGTIEGEIIARDLLVGPTGQIKGNVSVDQADIQGKVFDRIEAKVCLSLRKTGRVEGSASYGDIEIEKGGVLSGEVSTIKATDKNEKTPIPKVQTNLPLPPHVVSNNTAPTVADNRTNLDSNKMSSVAGGQRPPLFDKNQDKK